MALTPKQEALIERSRKSGEYHRKLAAEMAAEGLGILAREHDWWPKNIEEKIAMQRRALSDNALGAVRDT